MGFAYSRVAAVAGLVGVVVLASVPASARGVGGFRGGFGGRGAGFGYGRLGAGPLGAPGGFSDIGIAGRGIGAYGGGYGQIAGSRFGFGPGGTGGFRSGGSGTSVDGHGFGDGGGRRPGGGYGGGGYGGYGGYGGAAGFLLGDYYGYGAGYGYGGRGYGAGYGGDTVVVRPPRPELPASAGIREAPTQAPAIYVIERGASGARSSRTSRGFAPSRHAASGGSSVEIVSGSPASLTR